MQDNGRLIKVLKNGRTGFFKAWRIQYEELRDGVGQFTCAIVEYDDGTVDWWPITEIQFTDRQLVEAQQ